MEEWSSYLPSVCVLQLTNYSLYSKYLAFIRRSRVHSGYDPVGWESSVVTIHRIGGKQLNIKEEKNVTNPPVFMGSFRIVDISVSWGRHIA